MIQKSLFFLYFILIGIVNTADAQESFSHEIGIIAGPVAFQSDYGERNNFDTNIGNTGYGVGFVHYMNFAYAAVCNCYTPETYFNDHFKLRSELSFSKTNLEHFGQWVEGSPSLGKDQLVNMKGSTVVSNIGMQLEFFPWSVRDFTSEVQSWGPFVAVGTQFSYYNAKAYSKIGTLGDPAVTLPKFLTPTDNRPYGFSNEKKAVWSVVSSIGTRYKFDLKSDLMFELRFQYFFSDWVDGVKPNPAIYKENKSNDWLLWFNVGYIYYL